MSLPDDFGPQPMELDSPDRQALCYAYYFLNHHRWLELLDKAHGFDSTATDTSLDHREATRLISASQFGSGAWLEAVTPDASLPFTRPRSGPYTIALQRRFGLYIESARGENNALEAAGNPPDWLGDAACNEGQHSTRHHAVNRAWHAALSAVATGTVLLGDKQEADKYKQYNDLYVAGDDIKDMFHAFPLAALQCWSMGLLRLDPHALTAESLDAALCVVQARCLEMGVAPSSNWAQRFLTEINLGFSKRFARANEPLLLALDEAHPHDTIVTTPKGDKALRRWLVGGEHERSRTRCPKQVR